MDHESVTKWLEDLRSGNASEAQKAIWDEFYRRVAGLARTKLGDFPKRVIDEEDIAISVFDSFFKRHNEGQFPELDNRGALWTLLATITVRKVINQRQKHYAKKRGQGRIRGESMWSCPEDGQGLDAIPDAETSPEFIDDWINLCGEAFDRLQDDTLKEVARYRLAGYSNAEIAEKLGVVERTVERKMRLIRQEWSDDSESSDND